MIIKGKSRGRSQQLAAHLLRADQNERVRLVEVRGAIARVVPGALAEFEARASAVHSSRPLYHASISPEAATPLTPAQVRIAVDTLERKLGLTSQPRLVVLHRKEGREHLHVVWSRIDLARQRLISDSWSYRRHEEAARELEARFGHRQIEGAHGPRGHRRRKSTPHDHEFRQAERSGWKPGEVATELTALWRHSEGGEEFKSRLERAGYVLARGDRRVFVVVDRAGEVHSLARRIEGINTRELRKRLAGTKLAAMPSVSEARGRARSERRSIWRSEFRAAANGLASAPRAIRQQTRPHAVPQPRDVAGLALRQLVHPISDRAGRMVSPMRRPAAWQPAAPLFRTARAIIIAEFASKIAAALRDAPPHEVDAILARLIAERRAALDALRHNSVAPRSGRGGRGRSARAGRRHWLRLRRARFARRRRVPA